MVALLAPTLAGLACAGAGTEDAADAVPVEAAPAQPVEAPAAEPDEQVIRYDTLRSLTDDPGCPSCFVVGPEHVAGITASSTLAPAERYGAAKLLDGELTTAWCEGADGDGAGAGFEIALKEPMPVDRITIHPGYLKSAETLFGNARPATLRVATDRGDRFRFELPEYPDDYVDAPGYVYPTIALDGEPVSTLRVEIVSVYPGREAADLCVSGVLVEVLDG